MVFYYGKDKRPGCEVSQVGTPLCLHWDSLDKLTRQEILLPTCLNERLQHYSWAELDDWVRDIIKDHLTTRSKGTVIIGE